MLLSTTAPTNTLVLWGKTNINGNLLELLRYDSVGLVWVAITNPGNTLYSGTTLPAPESATQGDQFLNTDTLDLYERGVSTWSEIATLATTAPPPTGMLDPDEDLDELANKATSAANLGAYTDTQLATILAAYRDADADAIINHNTTSASLTYNLHNLSDWGKTHVVHRTTAGTTSALFNINNGGIYTQPVGSWLRAVNLSGQLRVVGVNSATVLRPAGKTEYSRAAGSEVFLFKLASTLWFLTGDLANA